jgi:hypothetical protein
MCVCVVVVAVLWLFYHLFVVKVFCFVLFVCFFVKEDNIIQRGVVSTGS